MVFNTQDGNQEPYGYDGSLYYLSLSLHVLVDLALIAM